MDEQDLKKDVKLNEFGNFSIGIQYTPRLFDMGWTTEKRYERYVKLLYECSDIRLFNFRKGAHGSTESIGGE